MIASGRLKMSGVPVWRCLQQMIRAPLYPAAVPSSFHCRAFAAHTPSTVGSFLKLGPVSWPTSRQCHGGSQRPSKRADAKEDFSMRALSEAPKPALYLGISGLVPFLSAPLLMAMTQTFYPEVAYAQMVYGASIVSFLGGARWGFAIPSGSPAAPDWMNLGNSVVPSLLAWVALLCKDNITEGALVVLMGLGLSLHYDLNLLHGYPAWFKAMRTVLTVVATFSLVATLVIKKFCPEKKIGETQK
ncbi:transmembrane protein 69-like [Pholidichthys leucotaenia]